MLTLWQFCFQFCVIAIISSATFLCHVHAQAPPVDGAVKPSSANASSNPHSRLIAKVGEHPITIADLDAITSKVLQGISDPVVILRIQSQALDDLINGYLATDVYAQMGESQNLQAIRQLGYLKRQVVMNYYLSSNIGSTSKPDPRKIDLYLQKHPDLVARRQMFHFKQILIDASHGVGMTQVQELSTQDSSLQLLQRFLKESDVPSQSINFWRDGSQLNSVVLSNLSGLKKDGISISLSKDQKSIAVLKLYDAYPDPVSLEEAQALIIGSYEQDTRNQVALNLLSSLRLKGNVQIFDHSLALIAKQGSVKAGDRFGENAITIWIFSLLILVPVAVVVFYRQRISPPMDENPPPRGIGRS